MYLIFYLLCQWLPDLYVIDLNSLTGNLLVISLSPAMISTWEFKHVDVPVSICKENKGIPLSIFNMEQICQKLNTCISNITK